MQASALPTPPLSDSGEMERGQRLPPISTLAGYIRENAASNASPTSQQQAGAAEPSLKRKRSYSQLFTNDHDQRESKRQSTIRNTEWPHTTRAFDRGHGQLPSGVTTSLPIISPAVQPSAHPAASRDRTAAADYSPRYTNRPSPQSSSSASERKVGCDSSFAPTSAYTDRTGATQISPIDPTLSQKPFDYRQPQQALQQQQQQQQQTLRSLPPLVHSDISRPVTDRAAEIHPTRPSLPAFGSLSEHQSAASRHYYSSYPSMSAHHTFSPRELPAESQRSTYAYPSPQGAQQHQPLQPPFSYEPAPGSSYSFDRRPSQPEERRALPSMPGLSDPLPPPAPPIASHSTTSPAHSLERYRFDANSANDHPARRRRGNLPKEATARLNEWFAQHANYPYPKEEEKQRLQEQTGLSMSQIGNWFINARRRRKPTTAPRPLDTTLPPPQARHAYAAQTTPHVPHTLPPPPPSAHHDRARYPYPQLPPPYP